MATATGSLLAIFNLADWTAFVVALSTFVQADASSPPRIGPV